jgi:hypothetical protein
VVSADETSLHGGGARRRYGAAPTTLQIHKAARLPSAEQQFNEEAEDEIMVRLEESAESATAGQSASALSRADHGARARNRLRSGSPPAR